MGEVGFFEVLVLIGLLWLSVISYFVWRERKIVGKLFPRGDEKDIRNKFKELIELVEGYGRREKDLTKNLQDYKKESLRFIQKIAVSRYNPYADTGGDQSFSVAVLDGKLDGFLITSLHSRSGTRVYTKIVKDGHSDVELAKEEKEVLKKAVSS